MKMIRHHYTKDSLLTKAIYILLFAVVCVAHKLTSQSVMTESLKLLSFSCMKLRPGC